MPLPYTVIAPGAGNPLPNLTISQIIANINYLASMINEQIQIGAGAMKPSTTNGATPGAAEMGTNDVDYDFMDFAQSVQSYAQFGFELPSDYDGGTITFHATWTANSTSTNSVVWGLQLVAIDDDEALDAAWGTAQEVTDANKSTAYKCNITGESSAITIAGTPAAGKKVRARVYRLGSGSDTLAATARLIDLVITYSRT